MVVALWGYEIAWCWVPGICFALGGFVLAECPLGSCLVVAWCCLDAWLVGGWVVTRRWQAVG